MLITRYHTSALGKHDLRSVCSALTDEGGTSSIRLLKSALHTVFTAPYCLS